MLLSEWSLKSLNLPAKPVCTGSPQRVKKARYRLEEGTDVLNFNAVHWIQAKRPASASD